MQGVQANKLKKKTPIVYQSLRYSLKYYPNRQQCFPKTLNTNTWHRSNNLLQ